jgi:hypothetical protein
MKPGQDGVVIPIEQYFAVSSWMQGDLSPTLPMNLSINQFLPTFLMDLCKLTYASPCSERNERQWICLHARKPEVTWQRILQTIFSDIVILKEMWT